MSGQQPPYGGGPRGWNPRAANPASPSPSSFLYRPPSPWTPVAPSPPPIISGPRNVPMSPQPYGSMSPAPPVPTAARSGSRGPSNLPHPRPQWPQGTPSLAGNQSPAPFYGNQQPTTPTYAGAKVGPKPFQSMEHQHQYQQNAYGRGPQSSFQLSPTPSPIVCQTPNSEFMYNSRQTPNFYDTQQRQRQQPPLPRQQSKSNAQYEYVDVPPEPLHHKSYVIYDDEEEYGPSTAEIIANQSQDYVDEKLAEYQMTILQLQGMY